MNTYSQPNKFKLIILFLFVFQLTGNSQNNIILKILESSEAKLDHFLELIPKGREFEYGFKNRDEFKKAQLQSPINIIYPTESFYLNDYVDTSDVNLEISNSWDIPISINDTICCFLQGKLIENEFKVFGIGGNEVAKNINRAKIDNLYTSKPFKSFLVFPGLQKEYLVFHNSDLSYKESICLSHDEALNKLISMNLIEALIDSKNSLTEKKIINEY
jgi:hypothetical protein